MKGKVKKKQKRDSQRNVRKNRLKIGKEKR